MKYIVPFIVLFLSGCAFGQETYETPEQLVEAFEQRYEQKNIKGIQRLFYKKNARPESYDALYYRYKIAFDKNEDITIVSLTAILPTHKDRLYEGIPFDGRILVPTIENVSHTLEYKTTGPNPVFAQFDMGLTKKGYKFSLMKIVDAPEPGLEEMEN